MKQSAKLNTVNKWWQYETTASQKWFQFGLKDLYYNRGLILRFTRRDLLASYQQTVIGPFWIFLQPLLTALVYLIVFGRFAKMPTDGIPPILFYLAGSTIWSFFFDSLNGTMYTFISNTHIFNKVYFPRLVVPMSIILTQAVRLGIQLVLFALIYVFYYFIFHTASPSKILLLLPLLVLLTAGFAFGLGLLISIITAKYRDLDNILQFFLRLFMFATPVVYPASIIPDKYQALFWLNPLTPIIETFRAAFVENGKIPYYPLAIAGIEIFFLISLGLLLFKKRELDVMDSI
ncbi:ABC transporter permease [Pedobacter psychroterrae]|uniref:Transport permease protein n=1 Tax=Pedobacter psychroterrae TaxID=2530453 RepID=A0A4R0NIC8_9SPHI|nr:ABC transporter permease [Pedobacter psychroterrae]TCD00420.1 ABC transporter permease [Pedobacter psychroterrae]